MIVTPNLLLVPFSLAHYEALATGNSLSLGRLLEINTPQGWTEYFETPAAFPEQMEFYNQLQGDERWGSYFIIHTADKELIGSCGFKGLPCDKGLVEFGYEIKPAYRQRGYATETAMGLVSFAFSQPEINGVFALTLPEVNYSVKVLRKCGLIYKKTIEDPADGTLWRWEKMRK